MLARLTVFLCAFVVLAFASFSALAQSGTATPAVVSVSGPSAVGPATPQQPFTPEPTPTDSTPIKTELGAGALIAVGSAELLEILKRSRWFKWVGSDETKAQANRIASGIMAVLAGLGLSLHFDKTWDSTTHTFVATITITGLAWASVAHGFTQWVQQQVYYRLILNRQPATT